MYLEFIQQGNGNTSKTTVTKSVTSLKLLELLHIQGKGNTSNTISK